MAQRNAKRAAVAQYVRYYPDATFAEAQESDLLEGIKFSRSLFDDVRYELRPRRRARPDDRRPHPYPEALHIINVQLDMEHRLAMLEHVKAMVGEMTRSRRQRQPRSTRRASSASAPVPGRRATRRADT